MATLISVLISIVAVFVAYTIGAPVLMNRGRFQKVFMFLCPERKLAARVEAHAAGAAIASAYGAQRMPVRSCSLLKAKQSCDGACLKAI
jgi:hypothetical protein